LAHALSQATLAKEAGLSRKALNEIEGLVNTNPSLKTLEALAHALHMPLPKLIT
jgi:DNA-binding XRE family transcriptional regulator